MGERAERLDLFNHGATENTEFGWRGYIWGLSTDYTDLHRFL
jgi:hypothetical protein